VEFKINLTLIMTNFYFIGLTPELVTKHSSRLGIFVFSSVVTVLIGVDFDIYFLLKNYVSYENRLAKAKTDLPTVVKDSYMIFVIFSHFARKRKIGTLIGTIKTRIYLCGKNTQTHTDTQTQSLTKTQIPTHDSLSLSCTHGDTHTITHTYTHTLSREHWYS